MFRDGMQTRIVPPNFAICDRTSLSIKFIEVLQCNDSFFLYPPEILFLHNPFVLDFSLSLLDLSLFVFPFALPAISRLRQSRNCKNNYVYL